MTDTLLILSIIISLVTITLMRPRAESTEINIVTDPNQKFAHKVIIVLWWFDSQNEINALDSVYIQCKADLIRSGKELDENFMTQCLTVTENYYQLCRTKLQLNGATDIASLN